jgi:hypothetical protein
MRNDAICLPYVPSKTPALQPGEAEKKSDSGPGAQPRGVDFSKFARQEPKEVKEKKAFPYIYISFLVVGWAMLAYPFIVSEGDFFPKLFGYLLACAVWLFLVWVVRAMILAEPSESSDEDEDARRESPKDCKFDPSLLSSMLKNSRGFDSGESLKIEDSPKSHSLPAPSESLRIGGNNHSVKLLK